MSCERELIQVAKGREERAAKPGFSPWVLKEKLRAGLAWWALDWLNYFPSPDKFLMFSFVTSYNPRIVLWYGKGKCVEPQAGDRVFCASVYISLCDGNRNRTQWPWLPLPPINNYCIFVVQDDGFHYDIFCPLIACTQLSKHVTEEILSWGTLYWWELSGLWLELPQMGSHVTCGDLHGLGVLWWLPPLWCTDVDSGPWQPRLRSL